MALLVPCPSLSVPHVLIPARAGVWQNLFEFSIFVVGLNLQISHFFQTRYNYLESLRIIAASVFVNKFLSILHIVKQQSIAVKPCSEMQFMGFDFLWSFCCCS